MIEISRRMKTITFTLLFIFCALMYLSADSVWEGSAAMGRYGEFPFTGFYGASNSFPQNAFVEVENLENGKRTRLIVVNRLSDPSLLMLVSNEAAQELGIYQNDIVRIKVRLISNANTAQTPQFDDLAYNPDPDINPAASLMTPEELITGDTGAEAETEEGVSEEPEPEVEPARTVGTTPVEISGPEGVIAEAEPATATEPEILSVPNPPDQTGPQQAVESPEVEEPVIPGTDTTASPVIAEEKPAEGSQEQELWTDNAEDRSVADEGSFPVLSELPPVTDGLSDAEVLIGEQEVPADIAEDSPEKPFEWPESLKKPEPAPEPDPLYLTMDALEDGEPASDDVQSVADIHSPETEVLWPDSGNAGDTAIAEGTEVPELTGDSLAYVSAADSDNGIAGETLQLPESRLELLSSGINETEPALISEQSYRITVAPEIVRKEADSDAEYLTDASDYHSPITIDRAVAAGNLPEPEPEIPEEVIAVLVGDHLSMPDYEPETESMAEAYLAGPELIETKDGSILAEMIADAEPEAESGLSVVLNTVPVLQGSEESRLVDVANGYVAPDKPDFVGKIQDYPNVAEGGAPVDVPSTGDELAYSTAPEPEVAKFPAMTEVPEVAKSDESVPADTGDVEIVEPEYDENLEISLVPAEVRPPELVKGDTGLLETEPEEGAADVVETAGDVPGIEAPSVVDAEGVAAPVEPPVETKTEPPEVTEAAPTVSTTVGPTVSPAEIVVETPVEVVTAVPAETRAPAVTEPERELTAPEQVMMVSKLQQQRHYLQLGAYKEKNSAIKAAGKLDASYPVTILTDEGSSGTTYKLLLGPLSDDESGIMLYNFRAGGYSDAFIRRIE